MSNDDALTADEVAGLLQVSRSTVYKLVKADELASYHIGRKMRFTMADVENYIARSKAASVAVAARSSLAAPSAASGTASAAPAPRASSAAPRAALSTSKGPSSFVLAGNDIVGDILANYLGSANAAVERVYEGSYNALVDLYRGVAHAALSHLCDGDSGSYNVAAVKRLVPGTSVKVVRLVRRRQGLIVARGNPKGLRTWEDLLRPGVRLVNRERGCGSRILLDEQLVRLGADRVRIEGYEREATSALSMASFVARGGADAGIGAERVFHQVEGVDFLPLQDAVVKLTRSRPFREEVGALVGYDASRMGEVVYES